MCFFCADDPLTWEIIMGVNSKSFGKMHVDFHFQIGVRVAAWLWITVGLIASFPCVFVVIHNFATKWNCLPDQRAGQSHQPLSSTSVTPMTSKEKSILAGAKKPSHIARELCVTCSGKHLTILFREWLWAACSTQSNLCHHSGGSKCWGTGGKLCPLQTADLKFCAHLCGLCSGVISL